MLAVPKTKLSVFLVVMCVLMNFFGKSIFARKQSYAVHVL